MRVSRKVGTPSQTSGSTTMCSLIDFLLKVSLPSCLPQVYAIHRVPGRRTYSATDTDAMYQFTDQAALWQEKVREAMPEGGGIKAAVEWRDAPSRDYRAAGHSQPPGKWRLPGDGRQPRGAVARLRSTAAAERIAVTTAGQGGRPTRDFGGRPVIASPRGAAKLDCIYQLS